MTLASADMFAFLSISFSASFQLRPARVRSTQTPLHREHVYVDTMAAHPWSGTPRKNDAGSGTFDTRVQQDDQLVPEPAVRSDLLDAVADVTGLGASWAGIGRTPS